MEEKRIWNYAVTAHKPTTVSHSSVGSFTHPRERNLIIAKCTRIEIHLITAEGLQPMLDVPIYGRIATLELLRPHGETQDLLFITTEKYKFCVLQWDTESSRVMTRATGDVSDQMCCPTVNGQIGIVDPDWTLIGLHLYDGLFKVITFDDNGQLREPFDIRLEVLHVLDIKFLYGCPKPTIAVLYQYNNDTHVITYEISLEHKTFTEGPWTRNNLGNGASFLIPVPPPLCGVLIIGDETVVYCSASGYQGITKPHSMTRAYGRVNANGSQYLLGDLNGNLHQLVITRENENGARLRIQKLGVTSIASTISSLDNGLVYIGSSYGDSQLVRLNLRHDADGSRVEVLESYVNLGPIMDFCVVDLERQGQGQVVTCSGSYKDGSLRIAWNGIGVHEQASVDVQGIKGMWSLRSASDDPYDTFLVVSFINETRIFRMNSEKKLVETQIKGFDSHVQTLFCHDAVHNQLVQVTSKSVRYFSSTTGELKGEWHAPDGHSVNVATANASQVLLSTGGGHLVYLQISNGMLTEVKSADLENDISCLDINPIGENPNFSEIASVGMSSDISVVGIYSLPNLDLIANELLEGTIIPCSVLMCSFEGISYLLCALEDGHLLSFVLTDTGELIDRKKVSLGTQPITLRTFSSKDAATRVFAVSGWPTVIYSSNKKQLYSTVNLKEVSHMCPINFAAFPASLAFAKEGKLTIGTIDENQRLHIRAIRLQEHARLISHQKQSRTFVICTGKDGQLNGSAPEVHSVHLLDDQTFGIISSFLLDQFEYGCSISNCSFSGDTNVYYCIGTAVLMPEENEPTKGRILVFRVDDGKLQLIAMKETNGAVSTLNAFNGKLIAAINKKIKLYKWESRENGGNLELQTEYRHRDLMLPLFVQTRGNFIVVGDLMKSISLLIFKHEEIDIEELARDYNAKWMSAVEILDDDVFLGAETNFNLFTVRKNNEGSTYEERSRLEVVGEYHLGEFVNRFQHGSLVMRLPDSDVGQIPTVLFGTMNGVIGVIASLPNQQYLFLENLQTTLRKVIKGVGELSHEEWRSFYNEERTEDAKNFVDGDLIESFLDLSREQMEEISKAMSVPVEELMKTVEELTRLH